MRQEPRLVLGRRGNGGVSPALDELTAESGQATTRPLPYGTMRAVRVLSTKHQRHKGTPSASATWSVGGQRPQEHARHG